MDQGPLAVVAIFASALVYTYFSKDVVYVPHLQFWLGLVIGTVAIRMYWYARWVPRPRTSIEVNKALKCLFILASATSAIWGIGGSLLLNEQSLEHFAITVFIIAALAAGVAGIYGANFPMAVLFLSLLVLPFAGRLILVGEPPFITVGVLGIIYFILMILVVNNSHRHIRKSIEIGLDNEDLVQKLSEASHEIRTPVATITGFADILAGQDPGTPPTIKQYANIIRRNCVYLKRLVDNVMVLSKSPETGPEDIWESVRVREQVDLALDVVRGRAQQKDLYLNIHYAENVPEKARICTLKFQQILINLLTNAVKFTRKGGVDVDVKLSREAELVIRVADTGVGITKSNLDRIFQPYFREDRPEVQTEEGTGLGLSVSMNLALSMGGELYLVDAECDKGCIFELRLPLVV